MNWTGFLRIQAAPKEQRTILKDCQFSGTFKVTRPVYVDDDPTVYCIHVGGGYVDGDRYKTEIMLEENASLTVTTQAATKIYKTPHHPVYQETSISLKKGSSLVYLPDPVIAYENARFVQETTIHMEKGASLLYSDIITPGWAKSGSHFQYDYVRSKVKVFEEGKLLVFDHLFLNPSEHDLTSTLQMEGYTHFGSLLIIHPELSQKWVADINEIVEGFSKQLRFGISSTKGNGAVIRILALNTPSIESAFQACTDYIRGKQKQQKIVLRKY